MQVDRRAQIERFATNALWLFVLVVFFLRLGPNFIPYTAETDWKQWVWEYHRYAFDDALPAGNVLTDYGLLMQPPLYWVVMATLCTVLPPVIAASLVNAAAMGGALYFCARVVERKTSPLFGAAAAALLARDDVFHKVTVGGYPRSFGPTITLMFLCFWIEGRHRLVLLTLVLGAGLYPSVVVPCALAYGTWCVLFAGRAGFFRRNLELAVCAVAVAALSLLQNFRAPSWWGPVRKLADCIGLPELGPHGRFPWLPFPSFWPKVMAYVGQPFGLRGFLGRAWHVYPWSNKMITGAFIVVTLALVVAGIALCVRRRAWLLPLHPLAFGAACVVSFWLARVLAFELYLPHRMVQHTLPYAVVVLFVVVVVVVARELLPPTKATYAALALVLAPFVVAGEGLFPTGHRSYAKDKPLYQWIEKHTPLPAQFAGTLQVLDELPLFARRGVYVNWKMAHPVRDGFYAEMERRILAMYGAYYATDLKDVVAFCDAEHIDYFVVDNTRFEAVEKGDGQLFEPVRTKVAASFAARRAAGFALEHLPTDVVVFHHRIYDVVDVAKLRAFLQGQPQGQPQHPSAPP